MSSQLFTEETWTIGPISTPRLRWGEIRGGRTHRCPVCGVILLTGEDPGFCCGPQGSHASDVEPLPPLPQEFDTFINDPNISSSSRVLNLIFSFASLESTHPFPDSNGLPGFVAIQGKIYHRVRPTHRNSAVRWLLYDGFLQNLDLAPHQQWATILPPAWITAVRAALMRVNPFVSSVRILGQINPNIYPTAHLILDNAGTSTEIAAIMSYDNTTQTEIKSRRIVISRVNGSNQTIPTVSRLWEPLAYPLFFPQATLGWGLSATGRNSALSELVSTDDSDSPTTQMWHYRARLLREPRFQIFGRLTNEYLVDMFSRDIETRLKYIQTNQKRIRQDDANLMGLPEEEASENVYLPASFLGSRRWSEAQISDSLAIAATFGNPTFFITMTCNTNWPEIQSQLRPGQNYTDIPIVVVRVFKQKLTLLLNAIKTMFPGAGRVLYCIYAIEFQKRGLPHAHILIKFEKDCIMPVDIDNVVSAEMPSNPGDISLVTQLMMHNHPALNKPPSKYCQKTLADGQRICRFRYPHALQNSTTIDTEGRVHY
jgi:hypothetical protein